MSINEYVTESSRGTSGGTLENVKSPNNEPSFLENVVPNISNFFSGVPPEGTTEVISLEKQSEIEKNELTKKREILIDISALGKMNKYVGENYTVPQIRKMRKEKIEALFKLYKKVEQKEVSDEMFPSFVNVLVMIIGNIATVNDRDGMIKELSESSHLKKLIGNSLVRFTENYGDFISILTVYCIFSKHVSYSPVSETSPAPVSQMSAPVRQMPAPVRQMPAPVSQISPPPEDEDYTSPPERQMSESELKNLIEETLKKFY